MSPRRNPNAEHLSVADIVDAVARVVDSDGGAEALNMRRIAQECGVGAPTLYGYVRNKDELLGLYADRLLGAIVYPDASLPWEQQLRETYRAVYRLLIQHPVLGQTIGAQPLPGSAALEMVRFTVRALVGLGLDDAQVRVGYQALAAYITGFVLHQDARAVRTPTLGDVISDVRHGPAVDSTTDSDSNLAAFSDGLDVVLAGLVCLARNDSPRSNGVKRPRSRREGATK